MLVVLILVDFVLDLITSLNVFADGMIRLFVVERNQAAGAPRVAIKQPPHRLTVVLPVSVTVRRRVNSNQPFVPFEVRLKRLPGRAAGNGILGCIQHDDPIEACQILRGKDRRVLGCLNTEGPGLLPKLSQRQNTDRNRLVTKSLGAGIEQDRPRFLWLHGFHLSDGFVNLRLCRGHLGTLARYRRHLLRKHRRHDTTDPQHTHRHHDSSHVHS